MIDTQQEMSRELESGESLLWSGRPRQGVVFRKSDWFMVPFSLLWGGFAIFWEVSAVSGGAPFFFALFGVPFVLIGLHMIVGRFFVDMRQRARTYYALTNSRVIIIGGLFSRTVKSLALRTLSDVSVSEIGDRSGTITFGPGNPASPWQGGFAMPGAAAPTPCFELIPGAKEVYNQVLRAQSAAG